MQERQKARLNSWKEIADYLARDVRTAFRWAKQKGMPVHRVPGGRRRAVFAYTDELVAWLAGARPVDDDQRPLPEEQSKARAFRQWSPTRTLVSGGAVAIGLGVLLVGIVLLTQNNSSGPASRISFKDNKLIAWDGENRVLWTYQFPQNQVLGVASPDSYLGDLDGDGGDEVLVCVLEKDPRTPSEPNPELERGGELYCSSSAGELLWRFALHEKLLFAGSEYTEPWAWKTWRIYQKDTEIRIAATAHHFTFWPSVVVVLNGRGQVLGKFVNSGWIEWIEWAQQSGRPILLAAGVSNSRNRGIMALLDRDQISGSSPENPESEFECTNCPPGQPLRYFVFPQSELNQATGSQYASAYQIQVLKDRIVVHTNEVNHNILTTAGGIDGIYEFSHDFELKRTEFNHRYWELHRRLEVEGRIKHTREQCPDRDGPRSVRSWDLQNGWTELRP